MLLDGKKLPPLDSGVGDLGVITGVLAPGALLRRTRLSVYVAFLAEHGITTAASIEPADGEIFHPHEQAAAPAQAGAPPNTCAHDMALQQTLVAADGREDAPELLWKRAAVDAMISACELGTGGAAVVAALLDAGAPPEPVDRVDGTVNAKVGVAGVQPRKRRGGAGNRRVVLSPLHVAAKHGNEAAIRMLLKAGASLTLATASSRAMAAHFAAAHSATALSMLLDAGSPLRATDQNKQGLLHFAAREGNVESVSVLLQCLNSSRDDHSHGQSGAEKLIMQRDRWNRTAVDWACVNGRSVVLQALIEAGGAAAIHGMNMSAQKHHKRTHGRLQPPLHLAVMRAVTADAGQAVQEQDDTAKVDAKHESSEGGLACVDLLLAAKADVNAVDETGATALHIAAASVGTVAGLASRCYQFLLARDADPTILDGEGNTAAQLGPPDLLSGSLREATVSVQARHL